MLVRAAIPDPGSFGSRLVAGFATAIGGSGFAATTGSGFASSASMVPTFPFHGIGSG
jgi:hypothetical protein